MGAMFFGQYLLSKGIIDRDALIDGIELQRKKNLSLTALAVRRGYLESKDEEAILLRYRTSDADLEELCLQSGLLDRVQLDELLRIRRSDWMRIGSALVAGGHLTREKVVEQLAEFHDSQRDVDQELEANFQACRDPETVKTVVELAVFHLGRLSDRAIKLCTFGEDTGALVDGRRRYAQKLVGDRELFVALDLEPEMAAVVAEGLIGMPLPAGSEAAIDAVCECVNIIGGNACTRLEASGLRLRPEPPFSTEGSEPADGSGFIVRAQVIAGEAEMDVRVFL
jgi:hypothetical protein